MDLNYDIGCFDLASDFLRDVEHATQADIHRLAQLIQTTIDDFIGYDAELNARAKPK